MLSSAALAEVRLVVTGANERLATNIRNHVGPLSDSTASRPRALQRQLTDAVTDASRALGYFQTEWDVSVVERADAIEVTIAVEPGPRLRWASPQVQVTGPAAELPAVEKLVRNHPFKIGAPVEHPVYDQYKQDLLDLLLDRGFLDARYDVSRLRLNAETRTGQPLLTLTSGPRYRFGSIDFEGSELSPSLLKRLVPFSEGDPYQRTDLTALYRQLQDSLYFRSISVRTDSDTDEDSVAVRVALEDAPRHRILVGAGYGTDTGARVRLRWERPYVNAAGHRLTTEARISTLWQELETEYRIPLAEPLWQTITATGSLETRDIEDTESTIASVGLFYTERWRDYWHTSIGATFENESYRQGSAPRQHVSYLVPAASITGLTLPEISDPLYGHRTWATIAGSSPELGADTSFVRATAGHKRIFHLGGSHLLIGRFEVGTLSTDEIDLIPASQRFFTGGDQTVRGYDFESISSENPDGTLRGGRHLNIASLEYSFKILPQWRLALFTDSGRAYNSSDEPWRSSAGIGVRWLSPVGQIRVDLAAQIGDEADGFRIHVFMGPPL